VEFKVDPSDTEAEPTTWSIADMYCVVSQLEREIYSITLNEQMWFNKKLSIHFTEFEAWLNPICILVLRKPIKQSVFYSGDCKTHPISKISDSIWRIYSSDNGMADNSWGLHIGNVKEAYWSTNKCNYIQHTFKYLDRSPGHVHMEVTLAYSALQGWYNIDSATLFNLLCTADIWENTRRAHLSTSSDVEMTHFSTLCYLW